MPRVNTTNREMSENLFVRRSESEDDGNASVASPKKSTSLSSLRSLRDTFKRSESSTSQTSLPAGLARTNELKSSSSVGNDADGGNKSGKSFHSMVLCHRRLSVLADR